MWVQHGGPEHGDAQHGEPEHGGSEHGDTKVSHSATHGKGAVWGLGLHAFVMRCGQRGMTR